MHLQVVNAYLHYITDTFIHYGTYFRKNRQLSFSLQYKPEQLLCWHPVLPQVQYYSQVRGRAAPSPTASLQANWAAALRAGSPGTPPQPPRGTA